MQGGYLILNEAQLGDLNLLCMIKRMYPLTHIYAEQRLCAGDEPCHFPVCECGEDDGFAGRRP